MEEKKMHALVIYDLTGYIWNIIYGVETVPQGLPAVFVDIPEGAALDRIDVTDPENPKPVFTYLPDTDIGRLQKEMSELKNRVDEAVPMKKEPGTLEEWQAEKKREIALECERTIYNGVTVQMEKGSYEHFALTEHDQLNLFGKQAQLAAGVAQLEYHADGQPCRYYSAAEMQAIIGTAMFHVSYHTTYCNALNMWIAGCQAAEEVKNIFYGADVPEEYRSEVLNAYLVQIAEMAGDGNETAIVE